jgi:hypothetical protein
MFNLEVFMALGLPLVFSTSIRGWRDEAMDRNTTKISRSSAEHRDQRLPGGP